MKPESMMAMASMRHAFVRVTALVALVGVAASVAHAQAVTAPKQIMQDSWRISGTAGAYVPRSAMIVGADGRNTQLAAAPSVSLELQYLANRRISIYASGVGAFSTLARGTAIQPTAVGPSNNVTLIGTTGGLVLGLFGDRFQPATVANPSANTKQGIKRDGRNSSDHHHAYCVSFIRSVPIDPSPLSSIKRWAIFQVLLWTKKRAVASLTKSFPRK